jgi:hypothetical protein
MPNLDEKDIKVEGRLFAKRNWEGEGEQGQVIGW